MNQELQKVVDKWKQYMDACERRSIECRQAQGDSKSIDADIWWMRRKLVWDIIYEVEAAARPREGDPYLPPPALPSGLPQREALFLAELLEQGSESVSRQVCSDMSNTAYNLFTDEEKHQMMVDYELWNGGGQISADDKALLDENYFIGQSWPWMNFYAAKFRAGAKEPS